MADGSAHFPQSFHASISIFRPHKVASGLKYEILCNTHSILINILEFYSAMVEWRKLFKRTHIYTKNFPFPAHFGFASHTFLFLEAERDINLKNPILERAYPTNMALNKKASIFLSFLYKKFKNRGMCVRVVTKV